MDNEMEKDRIPWILLNTLIIDLCHPGVWVSTLKAQVCQNKTTIKK